MERLTEIDEGAIVFCDNNAHHLYRPEDMSPAQTKEILERLFLYENIGSPVAFAELVKAKTEGRLVELLCNVGDKVYCHDGNEWNVYHIELFDGTTVYRLKHGDKGYFAVTTEEFNKKWWFTRAEAENTLERQAAHE